MKLWEIGKLLHGGDYNVDQWLDRPDILAEDIRLMKLAGEDFNIFHGVMTWMNGDIDIAPETMYADSYPYTAQSASIAVG